MLSFLLLKLLQSWEINNGQTSVPYQDTGVL